MYKSNIYAWRMCISTECAYNKMSLSGELIIRRQLSNLLSALFRIQGQLGDGIHKSVIRTPYIEEGNSHDPNAAAVIRDSVVVVHVPR